MTSRVSAAGKVELPGSCVTVLTARKLLMPFTPGDAPAEVTLLPIVCVVLLPYTEKWERKDKLTG